MIRETGNFPTEEQLHSPDEERQEKLTRLTGLIQEARADLGSESLEQIYEQLEGIVLTNDFYGKHVLESKSHRFRDTSMHSFFLNRLPEMASRNELTDERQEKVNRNLEILRLIEELEPPTMEYFFSGREIVTGTKGAFSLGNGFDVDIEIECVDPNGIWKYRRFGETKEENPYRAKIRILDEDGGLVYDFQDALPSGAVIAPGSDWIGTKDMATFRSKTDGGEWKGLPDEGLVVLAHEIGHVQQHNDEDLARKYLEATGREMPERLRDDRFAERDAWARGLRLLRSIEKKAGRKIFPTNKEVVEMTKKPLRTYGAEHSSSVRED